MTKDFISQVYQYTYVTKHNNKVLYCPFYIEIAINYNAVLLPITEGYITYSGSMFPSKKDFQTEIFNSIRNLYLYTFFKGSTEKQSQLENKLTDTMTKAIVITVVFGYASYNESYPTLELLNCGVKDLETFLSVVYSIFEKRINELKETQCEN